MNIPEALTVATKAIELIQALRAIDHKISEAELKSRLADILSSTADVKMALVEANQELAARDGEIERLKKAFAFRGETIEKHNMLYERYKDRPVGMPFCPRCLEVDGRYIKLAALQKEGKPTRCPQCKSDYERQSEFLAKGEAKGD